MQIEALQFHLFIYFNLMDLILWHQSQCFHNPSNCAKPKYRNIVTGVSKNPKIWLNALPQWWGVIFRRTNFEAYCKGIMGKRFSHLHVTCSLYTGNYSFCTHHQTETEITIVLWGNVRNIALILQKTIMEMQQENWKQLEVFHFRLYGRLPGVFGFSQSIWSAQAVSHCGSTGMFIPPLSIVRTDGKTMWHAAPYFSIIHKKEG